jgi:hypothetical protein
MRFMTLYKPGKEATAPPSHQVYAEMGKLMEEMSKAGVLLSSEGLQPSAMGVRVRINGDKFAETDGPFSESKELIAGYAIIEVKSKQEAIGWAKRFLTVMGEGESEVRQMYDAQPH